LHANLSFHNRFSRPALSGSQGSAVIVHRLTVDGKDYFLPDPVAQLKSKVLEAVKSGGGYVNIPPINTGSGVDILFSPGLPVTWTQLDIGDDSDRRDHEPETPDEDHGSFM
jgi:hypothetical protein